MKITVLGPGCRKCETLEARVREVLERVGSDAVVEKVDDHAEIARRGVLGTPALAVDGTVVVSGRVPSTEEISTWVGRSAAPSEG